MKISKLNPSQAATIQQLAEWYFNEWAVPRETTMQRLSEQSPDDILFHLVVEENNQLIGTGGLYHNIGLTKVYEKFKQYDPWVGLIYTDSTFRNRGIGQLLLKEIERMAKEMEFATLYLYTNTAEKLYSKNGWVPFQKVIYREKETVVMKKEI